MNYTTAKAILKEALDRLRRFVHDKLDWGFPKPPSSFDGCSHVSVCKYCEGNILLDSQGNWFHLTREPPQ